MPRPWSCETHGPDAPSRWRPAGKQASGTPRRSRVCSLCVPERGPCLRGKAACPRCGGTVTTLVTSGRPGEPRYRRCAACRAAEQARYRAHSAELAEPSEFVRIDDAREDTHDAAAVSAQQLEEALGRPLSRPARAPRSVPAGDLFAILGGP